MTRRQTRSLIRLEAGVVSLFGALLGVARRYRVRVGGGARDPGLGHRSARDPVHDPVGLRGDRHHRRTARGLASRSPCGSAQDPRRDCHTLKSGDTQRAEREVTPTTTSAREGNRGRCVGGATASGYPPTRSTFGVEHVDGTYEAGADVVAPLNGGFPLGSDDKKQRLALVFYGDVYERL